MTNEQTKKVDLIEALIERSAKRLSVVEAVGKENGIVYMLDSEIEAIKSKLGEIL
jgi:hypothetical protein